MATKAIQQSTVSKKLIARWEQIGRKLMVLADEMPVDKFDYRPVDGVRTFADVLRHVAFWNHYVADVVCGKKGDDTSNEIPKSKFSTRAQVLGGLKRSIAEACNARENHRSDLTPAMVELLVTFIEHNCEHYGQLVVYARSNGIVPPASRG